MAITTEDVKKLCSLSRMKVSDEEVESLRSEIDAILSYVGEIDKVVSADTVPEYSRKNVFRDDTEENVSGENTEKLLSLSPDREGSYIKVKKIL